METSEIEFCEFKETVIGFVTYDDEGLTGGSRSSTGSNIVCERARPPRGTYLRIANPLTKDWYVGRIVDGPYATQRPGAYYIVELTSMIVDGQKGAVRNRPDPGTPVSILDPAQSAELHWDGRRFQVRTPGGAT